MHKSVIVILSLLESGFAIPLHARAGFDAAVDFSPTSNPNGVWSYGWTQTLGSSFVLDAIHQSDSGLDLWDGSVRTANPPLFYPFVEHNGTNQSITSGTITIAADQLGLHPGPSGEYSVVRFTTPTAGIFSLASAFSGLDFAGPTSTDVHVLLDGTSIFDGAVNGFGSGPSYATTRMLRAGDTVDFVVGYGANHTYFNDSTGLAARISAVPEPASLILLTTGAVGMLGLARRRKPKASLTAA